jgi:hypothetical protein
VIRKADLYILGIVLAVAGAVFLLPRAFAANDTGTGAVATVYYRSEEVAQLDLSRDTEYLFDRDGFLNRLIVKEGGVSVAEANCHGQECVHMGVKSKNGELIVCLPHELVIQISSDGRQALEVDTVVG